VLSCIIVILEFIDVIPSILILLGSLLFSTIFGSSFQLSIVINSHLDQYHDNPNLDSSTSKEINITTRSELKLRKKSERSRQYYKVDYIVTHKESYRIKHTVAMVLTRHDKSESLFLLESSPSFKVSVVS
jgi:hypothetical protein